MAAHGGVRRLVGPAHLRAMGAPGRRLAHRAAGCRRSSARATRPARRGTPWRPSCRAGWRRRPAGWRCRSSPSFPTARCSPPAPASRRWCSASAGCVRAGPTVFSELVAAALAEAAVLGVSGAGGLPPSGRLVAAGDLPGAAAAIDEHLPRPVEHVLLQADLTAVAPGPLETEVARRLHLLADVESRGGATVYRFTSGSLRRGFDAGWSAAEVRDFLDRGLADPGAAAAGVPRRRRRPHLRQRPRRARRGVPARRRRGGAGGARARPARADARAAAARADRRDRDLAARRAAAPAARARCRAGRRGGRRHGPGQPARPPAGPHPPGPPARRRGGGPAGRPGAGRGDRHPRRRPRGVHPPRHAPRPRTRPPRWPPCARRSRRRAPS